MFNKTLTVANEYINILKCDINAIHHERKLLLSDGSYTWIKKQEGLFDVKMGAYNGAEVYELVGMLDLSSKKYNKSNLEFTVMMDCPFLKIK